ncbi:LysR family transcriptional regulator [Gallaecimonas mangrovi]|uniref:LysR family transcriptional regulator n=1 Tax=Gallaecimonas mangrovi TaxID=2291597 RepID=UPI000E1FF6BE|nr:LysR family transcriptional regulator [Gallaecimonas mangrovi]
MKTPDLNLVIALNVLLREQNITAAARQLGLSTSAMSRTLTRLRVTTGDPLLVRAGRKMVLTPHAEGLRQRAMVAADESLAVLSPKASHFDVAKLARTFVIRCNEGFVEALGGHLIKAVAAQAPKVRLHFTAKAQKHDGPLRDGEADLEIGVLKAMGPEIRIQRLFDDRFVALVRHGHPLAAKRSITAHDYVQYGHVVASRHGKPEGPVDTALANLGLKRNIAAVVPSFPAALAVAQASDLVALVPASFAEHHPQMALLTVLAIPVATPVFTVSQMWHPRLEADSAHRWLRQCVKACCEEIKGQPS